MQMPVIGARDREGLRHQTILASGRIHNAEPNVPETSAYALMALGLARIGLVARRRKNA